MKHELRFLLINRLPRRFCTLLFGWFSRIEQPLVRRISIGVWKRFADLRLDEARTLEFRSLHDCFTRELKPGARPIDSAPDIIVSPCDAIVGASGRVDGTTIFQAKGFPYDLGELVGDQALVDRYRDGGHYVTLRLTPSMYHRFHAPADGRVHDVTYISGDTWNVDPISVRRIERLYCRNERVVIDTCLAGTTGGLTLVAVAAILVASVRLGFVDGPLNLRYCGPNRIVCDAPFRKGDELGYFEHGSTIIVFANRGLELCEGVRDGRRIRMGQPLLRVVNAQRHEDSVSA
jgi:phosphatidylserine decarboxylase